MFSSLWHHESLCLMLEVRVSPKEIMQLFLHLFRFLLSVTWLIWHWKVAKSFICGRQTRVLSSACKCWKDDECVGPHQGNCWATYHTFNFSSPEVLVQSVWSVKCDVICDMCCLFSRHVRTLFLIDHVMMQAWLDGNLLLLKEGIASNLCC